MMIEFNSLRGRCASIASRAVTAWYADHLYRNGTTLEDYVREQVLDVPDPVSPKLKKAESP